MSGKLKVFWRRLFGGSPNWSRREKVLEYVAYRLDAGAHLQEVVREEYVRRMATREEVERILTDPRVIEGARERMRRDLRFEEMPLWRTSRVDRPGPTPKIGRWPEDGKSRRGSAIATSDRSQEA